MKTTCVIGTVCLCCVTARHFHPSFMFASKVRDYLGGFLHGSLSCTHILDLGESDWLCHSKVCLCFVTASHFHPSVIFASKVRVYLGGTPHGSVSCTLILDLGESDWW